MNRRRAMTIAAACAFVLSLAGIGIRASYGAQVTGDEPYYLLSGLSLWDDGDLDISDELDDRDYLPFHEIAIDPQTKPLEGGRRVSPHDPLLPLLLAPAVGLGGWVAAKAALAGFAAALAAAIVWVAMRSFRVRSGVACVVVAVLGASAPLAVYGTQVYPEIVAALATTVALGALCGELKRRSLLVLGMAITVLPWLSVKYAPVAAAIALCGMFVLFRAGRGRDLIFFTGGLALSGVLFALIHLDIYGALTPYATGDHFTEGQLSVMGFEPDLAGRARRLVGLFVDDKFGLFVWQPAYVLALPALGWFAARKQRQHVMLLVVVAAAWLNATFVALTMQGWWFPGRQIVVILPLIAIAIATWADGSQRRLRVFGALGTVGIFSILWLFVEGWRGDVTMVVDFYETSNPLVRTLGGVLPDYLDVTTTTWALHGVWTIAAVVLLAFGFRSGRRTYSSGQSSAPVPDASSVPEASSVPDASSVPEASSAPVASVPEPSSGHSASVPLPLDTDPEAEPLPDAEPEDASPPRSRTVAPSSSPHAPASKARGSRSATRTVPNLTIDPPVE